jgi:hypothetical protein
MAMPYVQHANSASKVDVSLALHIPELGPLRALRENR